MSSQDKLEHVLRDIHVMISKSETYDADRIIVSKTDIFNLMDRLNASVYEIMDEYELTQQSRDRALREKKKEGDKIIWDASRQAEDIYAASVLYTEEALNHLNLIVQDADTTIGRLYQDFQENMKRQQDTIRENHLELKSQLQLLADTEKYLRLIEERNHEIERERAEKKGIKLKENTVGSLLKVKPEIRINEEYFRKAGIPLEKDEDKSKEEGVIERNEEGEVMTPLEDEGVIESSLKKAGEAVQEKEDAGQDKNKGKEDKKDNGIRKGKAKDKNKGKNNGKDIDKEPDKEKDQDKEKVQDKEKDKSEDKAKGSIKEGGTEPDEEVQAGAKNGQASPQGQDDMDEDQDTEEEIIQPHLGTTLEDRAAMMELLNTKLDNDYFKWKDDDFEEKEEKRHEKFSLLDKLMGKKRSF